VLLWSCRGFVRFFEANLVISQLTRK
jgi:hypothetical protein